MNWDLQENLSGGDPFDLHGSSFASNSMADGNWDTIGDMGHDLGGPHISFGHSTTDFQLQDNIDPRLSNHASSNLSAHSSPFTRPTVLPTTETIRQVGGSAAPLRQLPTPRQPRAISSDRAGRSRSQYLQPRSSSALPPSMLEYDSHPTQGLPPSKMEPFLNSDIFGGSNGSNQETSLQGHSNFSRLGTQTTYHNEILNAFANPSVPLRALDKFLNPFPAELVSCLERELSYPLGYLSEKLEGVQRDQQGGHDNGYQVPTAGDDHSFDRRWSQQGPNHSMSGAVIYHPLESRAPERGRQFSNPEPTPGVSRSTTPGRRTPSNRRSNMRQVEARRAHVYRPLPCPPSTWLAEPAGRPSTRFEYTKFGELLPTRRYTDQEINDFIQFHPGHLWQPTDRVQDKSSLIIWIQVVPADSKTRYPDRDHSSRCRFSSCPTKGGTIRTGEFRVCFDEQPGARWGGVATDPFHNAGYAHLYCMEKNVNFHKLCHDYRVQSDTRRLPGEGSNRMAITRDHASMLGVVEEYINRDPQSIRDALLLDDDDWFKTTLTYALTVHHRISIPVHSRATRNARKGFSINTHNGDLMKRAAFRSISPSAKKEFLDDLYKDPEVRENTDTYGLGMEIKDEEGEVDEDDEESEEEEEDEEYSQAGNKRKRQRRH